MRTFTGEEADPANDARYGYDALGRLATVEVWERNDTPLSTPETTGYEYDLVGTLDLQRNANGTIADYEYDLLNRLDTLTHYAPDATPEDLADNAKLAEFAYTVRADGKRTQEVYGYDLDADGVIEAAEQGTITWDYDALGRLTEETFSDPAFVDSLFTYDLAGNRTRQQRDTNGDGLIDEDTEYVYDANDRLREENVDLNGDGNFIDAGEKVTHYGYGPNDTGTQQTSKQVYEAGQLKTLTTNEYDLQGRLNFVTVQTYDTAGSVIRRETTNYVYDSTGIRVSSTQVTDADVDGTGGSTVTTTTYLSDPQNHTGYAQTLEEVTKDGTGAVTKRIVYTIGHDQISQTVYDAANPAGATHTFHADGHGSTRILTDLAGVILQHYAFDAYGNALGFDPAQALTSYLYSGESFDARIGQTYLRARWYDATTGRFNRFDPFFGNVQDPQSLHKYLYVHGDPVNGADPSGMFLGTTVGISVMLNLHLPTLVQGGLITTALLTGGNVGTQLRNMGVELAAAGHIDAGFQLYEMGNEVFGLTAYTIDITTTAVDTFGLILGATSLMRALKSALSGDALTAISSALRKVQRRPGAITSNMAALGRLNGIPLSAANIDDWKSLADAIRYNSKGEKFIVTFKRLPRGSIPGGTARYKGYPPQNGIHHGVLEVPDDATLYEVLHEWQHMAHHLDVGTPYDYLTLNAAQREYVTYRRLFNSPEWNLFSPQEQDDALMQMLRLNPDGSRGPDVPPGFTE